MNWLRSGHRECLGIYSSAQLIGLEIQGCLLESVQNLCVDSSLVRKLREKGDDGDLSFP